MTPLTEERGFGKTVTDAETKKVHQHRREFDPGGSRCEHTERSIQSVEDWETTLAFWFCEFLWMLLSPDYLNHAVSKKAPELAFLHPATRRNVGYSEPSRFHSGDRQIWNLRKYGGPSRI